MSSTGEIACFGKDLVEAYWASVQSLNNFSIPPPGSGLLLGGDPAKSELVGIVDYLKPLGFQFFAENKQIKQALESAAAGGCTIDLIEFPTTDKRALREVFQKYNIKGKVACLERSRKAVADIQLGVFNLASTRGKSLVDPDYIMRRNGMDFGLPTFVEPKTALLFAQCMSEKIPLRPKDGGIPPEVRRWSEFIGSHP